MNTAQVMPPVPAPPHDPTFWLLGADTGWRAAALDRVEIAPADGSLALAPLPGSGRSVTETSGSFGGVALPTNVAIDPDATLFLLDQQTATLKRFDRCTCEFQPVPCVGGSGPGPRQWRDPHGIGICGGNLFVCDTGHHRLTVFGLRGWVLRGFWAPPATAGLSNVWEPFDVAFDRRGRVFVSDGANGCIHRFYPSGHWETCFSGFGKVTHLAMDGRDRLHVITDGDEGRIRVVDTDGKTLEVMSRPERLATRFPELPVAIDAAGNLDLTSMCAGIDRRCHGPLRTSRVFDLAGNVTSTADTIGLLYSAEGSYLSQALDSRFYRCQWHRVIVRGEIPPGARVVVDSYTAEAEQPIAQIQDLPDAAWETRQIAHNVKGREWDCLVQSGGGRFLWLRLTLNGGGSVTPALESVRVEFPRISLRRYLPAVFAADPVSADFTDRFLGIFDTTLRSIERHADEQARLFDPLSAPAHPEGRAGIDFLTWLGTWIGVTLDRHTPEARRRQILKHAARLYHMRGTREGLWRQLLLFLDMKPEDRCCAEDRPAARCRPVPPNCAPVEHAPCAWQPPPLILEHFHLRRWLFLGAGRLGDQAVVWGKRIVNRSQLDAGAQVDRTQILTTQDPYRDPFHYYAHRFTVFVPASYEKSERRRKALENLLEAERPAHTQYYLEFVAPRLRIGVQSMIGFDSVVARYPEGVTLNHSPLGRASVLGGQPHERRGPSLAVGRHARVGSTTTVN